MPKNRSEVLLYQLILLGRDMQASGFYFLLEWLQNAKSFWFHARYKNIEAQGIADAHTQNHFAPWILIFLQEYNEIEKIIILTCGSPF